MASAGKIVWLNSKEPKVIGAQPVVGDVVHKLWTTINTMHHAELDENLRKPVLAELIRMHVACGMNLVLPEKCAVQHIADEQYNKYKALLSGITPENQAQIGKELKEFGIVSDAVVQCDESVGIEHDLDTARVENDAL